MIRLEDVTIEIEGRKILDHVNFEVKDGETKVLIGPSGAGKSSILRVVLGLWKPETGRVWIGNTEITNLSEREMIPVRRTAAMVFQGNALFDSLTVEENVGFFLQENDPKIQPKKLHERVNDCLEFVNMPDTNELLPEELSGGMKKRVAIARAIAFQPQIILYDEPTTGLDPVNAKLINELVLKLKTERKATSVVVTHILRDAFAVGDSMAMIKDGRIVFDGLPQDLVASKDDFVQTFISEIREESGLFLNGEFILK
jgi:phospholipid/cholesterol/gamma-HCH transport system ATP-binding protein